MATYWHLENLTQELTYLRATEGTFTSTRIQRFLNVDSSSLIDETGF